MENLLYIPGVETTKTKLLPEKPGLKLLTKGEIKPRGLDPSELFSHFTANIIKEKKVFTR